MTKNFPTFSSNDIKDFRSFIKTEIELKYDQFFHWKTFLSIIPIVASILNVFSNNPNTISLKYFLQYNFQSFGKNKQSETISQKYKFYSEKVFFENQEKPFFTPYQTSQLFNSGVFNSFRNEQKDFFSSQFDKNKNSLSSIAIETSNNKRQKIVSLPFVLSSSKYQNFLSQQNQPFHLKKYSKIDELKSLSKIRSISSSKKNQISFSDELLVKKLKLVKLNSLNATNLYYFLKKGNIYKKYKIQKNSIQNQSLRSMSGHLYFQNDDKTFLQKNKFNSLNSSFQIPFSLEQNYQNFLQKNTNTLSNVIVNPGTIFKFALKIDSQNNDIFIENPFILSKLVANLQYQSEYDDTSFDFFGGIIKKRKTYQYIRPSVDDQNNIYIKDLKKDYFLNKLIQQDESILQTSIIPKKSKYTTNVRETKNHFGDYLVSITPTNKSYLMSKGLVELSFATNSENKKQFSESQKNLVITIDIPQTWEFDNTFVKTKKTNSLITRKFKIYNSAIGFDVFEKRKLDQYQYFPTIFSTKNETGFLVNTHQYLTNSYWLALTQLSLCFFLISLLTELNKTYQKELAYYFLEFMSQANFYDEDIKKIIEQVYNDGNIRIFEPQKTKILEKKQSSFIDLAGMMELIPQFGQIVWHLKNQCRPTKQSNYIPQGILLVGPPGTGKTLLVKTIGAEAGVPVLIQSGNGVIEDTDGITKLQEAFEKARTLSPCILFIDEMDSIAAKRTELELTAGQIPNISLDNIKFRLTTNKTEQKQQNSAQKISALTQLLVEMDGIEKRRGFVVFGATNRRQNLDPALTRPGRFNDIIEIGLPDKTKRIEILKISTKKLGLQNQISWNFFAHKTVGFSAADLTTMANRSAIHSILMNEKHTTGSLLRGLTETKISSSNDRLLQDTLNNSTSSSISISLSYYEFGRYLIKNNILKIQKRNNFLLDFLLNEDYGTSDLQIDFFRSFKISDRQKISETIQEKIQTFRPKTTDLLLLIFVQLAGKASESIFLSSRLMNSNYDKKNKLTNLGEMDLLKANFLAEYYTKNFDIVQKEDLLANTKLENSTLKSKMMPFSTFTMVSQQLKDFPNKQIWNSKSIWLNIIGETFQNSNWRQWFRIHLPNPEPTIFNEEILFTDIFQNQTKYFKYYPIITNEFGWEDILKLSDDINIQNILFLSYVQILDHMDTYRQELDKLVFDNLKKLKNS